MKNAYVTFFDIATKTPTQHSAPAGAVALPVLADSVPGDTVCSSARLIIKHLEEGVGVAVSDFPFTLVDTV